MNSLVVLDLHPNQAIAYNIYSYMYGNLASTVRVIPPPIPIYLNFTYPTTVISYPNIYQWDFLAISTDTTYSYYAESDAPSSHYISTSLSLTGAWTLLAGNSKCKLLKGPSNTYKIYVFTVNSTTVINSKTTDVTSTLSTSIATNWKISNDCVKIA